MNAFEIYFQIGFEHILDPRLFTEIMRAEGYDHLLFVVALAAIYSWSDYKKVLILVTAFTIGHSITLILSTFDIFRASPIWIEFLIPLTIVLTAAYNIINVKLVSTKRGLRIRYFAALFFGLIHGLGFSNYLRALLQSEDDLLIPLAGFNLGLEAGQLVIVVLILSLHFIVSRLTKLKRSVWILIVSCIVLALSLPILFETGAELFK